MQLSSLYQSFAITEETDNLVSKINQYAPAKKIYLLGLTRSHRRTETLFTNTSVAKHWTTHYYLLVLIEKTAGHKLSETQDRLENNLQHFIPSTVLVIYLEEFIHWLSEGHPFANSIVERATLLFEEDGTPLPIPGAVNEEERKNANEELYKQTLVKVESFLSGAELYRLRKEYKFAAFMLHQAAEQSVRAMLIITIGLRVTSHNIDKMLRYASMFTHEAAEIISKEKGADKRLLKLLNDAYLDTRYREDQYTITLNDLDHLFEKVKRIKQLFENCSNGQSPLSAT